MSQKLIVALATMVLFAGCDRGPEMAMVSGTVRIDGKPVDGVVVNFSLDPMAGISGPSSFDMTDADGKFDLFYDLPNDLHGAVVGPHVVYLTDPGEEDRPPGPRRLRPEYISPNQTPLRYEVSSGVQVFDIELDAID